MLVPLVLACSARADDVPYHAVVCAAEAEVRAGAVVDPQLYATNRLKRGDHVEVIGDMGNGWLKIKPPSGSYSWIDAKQIQRIDPNYAAFSVSAADPVPVYMGSDFLNGAPPTVESCKVPRGAQVVAIGKESKDENGSWLAIVPPPAEVRYVRADAVSRSSDPAPPNTTLVGRLPTPSATETTLSIQAPLTKAQRMDGSGQDGQARHDAIANVPGYPSLAPSSSDPGRVSGLPSASADAPTVHLAPPSTGPTQADTWIPASSPPAQPAGIYASGPGRLRRAGRSLDNRPTYVLDGGANRPSLYVTPQSGIDLEPFLNRKVELFGPSIYRGDLRANYMSVMRVQPLPE
jgi:hypothetical protein